MSGRLTALIVDDERLARQELRSLLAAHPEIGVIGEAEDAGRAAVQIRELDPDVVFLDVQMPGRSGFDLLDAVDGRFQVVFVTAWDAHALRAFEVNALDHLLKPVHPERLAESVRRVIERRPAPGPSSRPKLGWDDHLFVAGERRARFVKVSAIACLRGAGDYSEVVLSDGDSTLVHRSLKEWESRLPEARFARIHRATIVNLDRVDRVERRRDESYQVFVRGLAEPLAMSRRHAARLKLALA